ncbi:MAG: CcoQ/FixQ family Cbb3-type cytochrome c oxidase assembly chaperone [Chitinophagaceae bacterium]|nr:CcoQ/FixQ family Cbb3-type cytochrome c oxidase assembly chaperone [Chitinophagaceae bacterium]
MKFINYLKTIEGVGIYPLISLLIFFTFFIGLLWYVVKYDKKSIQQIKNIPFENE